MENENLKYKLYRKIERFSLKFGSRKFNDAKNMEEYDKLVDLSIKCGLIPEENRHEYSTHGSLEAAIIYLDDRQKYCK